MATKKKATRGKPRASAKTRRVQMRSPVRMRFPVVVNRKKRTRSRRAKVAGLGGVLVTLLAAIAALTTSVIMLVVTILTATATVIATAATPADTTGPARRPSPPPVKRQRPPAAAPAGTVMCAAPTADPAGRCMNFTRHPSRRCWLHRQGVGS